MKNNYMCSIGWRERFQLYRKKRQLVRHEKRLHAEVSKLLKADTWDRQAINMRARKRCELQDEIIKIEGWLSQGARPLLVAPSGLGKGHDSLPSLAID